MAELVCSRCGRPCSNDAIVTVEPTVYSLCRNCYAVTNTCQMCINGSQCDFETNPSPLPKQVQQTVRQGNMVMQTIVKNPERIRETCQKGCKCFDTILGCRKQNGWCDQYKEIIPYDKINE